MLIQCTRKLLKQLDIEPESEIEEEPLFSWHANLKTINRRKAVILVNDKNRYVVVLYGLKAKDFKKFGYHVEEAIRRTFQEECIKDEVIEKYFDQSNKIHYSTTKNRSTVARLNNSCETVYFYQELLDNDSIYNTALSKEVSKQMVGADNKEYIDPNQEMYNELEVLSGEPIFSCKAVKLKVTLRLENHNVWRELMVPLNITFKQLHKVLQAAFDWKDYHLHEFYIYDKKVSADDLSFFDYPYLEDSFKPIVNLVCSEEAFYYENEIPMEMESGIKLSTYLPATVIYNYDFGDDWQHIIEVDEIIEDYDKNYPVCLDGEGKTPPEDVGGTGGYESFLEIMDDQDHPDHEQMKQWVQGQGYSEFDVEEINQRLEIYF